jgi:hypothetical protein
MKLPAFTMIAILAMAGCRHHHHRQAPPPPTSAPAPDVVQRDINLPTPPAPDLPVKQGSAPLAYLVESATSVRVANMETGQTLAQASAPAGSIVSVDTTAGVSIAGQLLVKGPLPQATFGIYLDNPTENQIRSKWIYPGR